jgi:cyclic beta-1,2-glucan synthetase
MRIAQQSPEDPIRAELFGIERLEQHAESLAAAQGVMRRSGRGWRLLLRDAHRVIANAIREQRAITPAPHHPARR